jgi:DNA-binding HxlR family transcriptional regulator
MGREARPPKACAVHALLEVLARPWTMHILWTLSQSPARFGALRRQVEGISPRVLTERLRELEKKGFVYRCCVSSTYGITKRMNKIGKVLGQLEGLARSWERKDGPGATSRRARRARTGPLVRA